MATMIILIQVWHLHAFLTLILDIRASVTILATSLFPSLFFRPTGSLLLALSRRSN